MPLRERLQITHSYHSGIIDGLLTSNLYARLHRITTEASIPHVHGLWNPYSIVAARIARQRQIPLVLSPMGMASKVALGLSTWKKRAFTLAFQAKAIQEVSCVQMASALEYENSLDYFGKTPFVIIPHGVEASEPSVDLSAIGPPTLLFLGRVSPVKNIIALVYAWAQIEPNHPSARLRIVGPADPEHAREIIRFATSLNLRRFSLEPCVDEVGREILLREATAVLLVSQSESSGMSIAEAIPFGRPVIVSEETPWARLVDHAGCGWTCQNTPIGIAHAMARMLTCSIEQINAMGQSGRRLIAGLDLSWDRSASELAEVHRWLLGKGRQPDLVQIPAASECRGPPSRSFGHRREAGYLVEHERCDVC